MSIGYACLTIGVLQTNLKSCMIRNASEKKLSEIIANNLNSLENIIDYNIKNRIKLFRISSDLIPFGSNPINNLEWWNIYISRFVKIGEKIRIGGIRVSMHPGQYTVLNSPREEVVDRAIEDLNYHAKVLDCLSVGTEHKIVLHIGGTYGDKEQAINRFVKNYQRLNDTVKKRLVVENDDKSYNIGDVLKIGKILNIPVIFDNLHNEINHSDIHRDYKYWIDECKKTWDKSDGYQKIHYSQQNPIKKRGSHSESIMINEFMDFYKNLNRNDLDIMIEVKDKNISAIKCINCTSAHNVIPLEVEWSKYKYSVLEKSPAHYLEIRKLLNNKYEHPDIYFYNLLEEAMKNKNTIGNSINAAQHIWGYFKELATEKEKVIFLKSIEKFNHEQTSISTIKNNLLKLTIKYNIDYLLNSYYFILK